MKFEVVKTNIVNVAADAIVLPANEALKEGSGTSRAIFEAAGRKKLTKACQKIGHCNTGSAIPTLAFDLNSKYIIHAVVPKWIDGSHNEYDLLCSAYLSSLKIAEIMGCESIAFPVLASGNNGFDKKLAVQIAEESMKSFENCKLKKAILVVYGDAMEAYMRGLGYDVLIIPDNLNFNKKENEHQAKMKVLLSNGKDAAQIFVENQLEKAIDWIKEPDNQKELVKWGKIVFQAVVSKKLL